VIGGNPESAGNRSRDRPGLLHPEHCITRKRDVAAEGLVGGEESDGAAIAHAAAGDREVVGERHAPGAEIHESAALHGHARGAEGGVGRDKDSDPAVSPADREGAGEGVGDVEIEPLVERAARLLNHDVFARERGIEGHPTAHQGRPVRERDRAAAGERECARAGEAVGPAADRLKRKAASGERPIERDGAGGVAVAEDRRVGREIRPGDIGRAEGVPPVGRGRVPGAGTVAGAGIALQWIPCVVSGNAKRGREHGRHDDCRGKTTPRCDISPRHGGKPSLTGLRSSLRGGTQLTQRDDNASRQGRATVRRVIPGGLGETLASLATEQTPGNLRFLPRKPVKRPRLTRLQPPAEPFRRRGREGRPPAGHGPELFRPNPRPNQAFPGSARFSIVPVRRLPCGRCRPACRDSFPSIARCGWRWWPTPGPRRRNESAGRPAS